MGILVGCDQKQEWLLSWWYTHLRKNNRDIPVAFGDFGMSEEARRWCEQRGILIPSSEIPPLSSQESKEVGWLYEKKRWRLKNQELHSSGPQRAIWFRKPLLMKQSPFTRTLWTDLDCQILGNLSPLFSLSLKETKVALKGAGMHFFIETLDKKACIRIPHYNSGVILFEKDSSLLDFWIFLTSQGMESFVCDDQILSLAISCCHLPVTRIPLKYNREYPWIFNPKTVILHWSSEAGKHALRLFALNEC